MLSIYYVLNLFILLIFYPIISAQLKDIRENVPVLESPTDFQGEEHVGSENKKHIVFIGESTMVALGMPSHKEAFAGTKQIESVCQKWNYCSKSLKENK